MSEWKTRITKVQVVKPTKETGEACLVLIYPPGPEMGKRFPLARDEIVLGRGPFTVAAERQLMRRHAIETLVAKASGGAATEAKLIAARELSIPIVMVRRPLPERGERVDTVDAALIWIRRRLALLDRHLRAVSTES